MEPSTSTCTSGDERVRLFGQLLETQARLSRDLGRELEDSCDLPLAWFEVLLRLRRSPEGRLTMTQIAEATVHSTGGTTRLVDRIEVAGYIARQNCPTDRRAIHVAITPLGEVKLNRALTAHVEHLERHIGQRLTMTERQQLSELLEKLQP